MAVGSIGLVDIDTTLADSTESFFLYSCVNQELGDIFGSFDIELSVMLLGTSLAVCSTDDLGLEVIFLHGCRYFCDFHLLLRINQVCGIDLEEEKYRCIEMIPQVALFHFFLSLHPFCELF